VRERAAAAAGQLAILVPVSETTREVAAYRARWEAVEAARAQELFALTEDEARRIIASLQPFAALPPDPDNGMGLVEQQAILHKRHRR